MGESKIPFKTNLDQKIGPLKKRLKNRPGDVRKPVKATEVDVAREKAERIKWVVRWVLILPVSVLLLLWMLLLFIDLFTT